MKFIRLFVPLMLIMLALTACNRDNASITVNSDSLSITVSESTINSAWRVVAPRVRIDNLAINLQPGQAVITSTLTPARGGAYPVQVTMVPTVSNGIVVWSMTSATINGVGANAEQLADINEAIVNSWNNYISGTYGARRVTAVTITENDITYTLSR